MCMITHRWLNQAFAVAEGYLANRILAHCLVPVLIKVMMVQVRIIVHCLVPVLIKNNNDSKRIGAGMDILAFTTSSNNSNICSAVSYQCDSDSNNGTNHNSTDKNSKTSKSNSNSNNNRNSSNNDNDHDSNTLLIVLVAVIEINQILVRQ